jgi:hypothetical protein
LSNGIKPQILRMPGIPFVSENSSDADWGNLRFVSTTVLDTFNLRRTCDSVFCASILLWSQVLLNRVKKQNWLSKILCERWRGYAINISKSKVNDADYCTHHNFTRFVRLPEYLPRTRKPHVSYITDIGVLSSNLGGGCHD